MIKAKATITSKGQVTLPIGLREFLGIDKGDIVIFEYKETGDKKVTMTKDVNEIKCPVCAGEGNVAGVGCIICRASGSITEDINEMLKQYAGSGDANAEFIKRLQSGQGGK